MANLKLRTKILLSFGMVTLLFALNMGAIFVGYRKITSAHVACRLSARSADDARELDRAMTAYELLARYFALTGDDADAKSALESETIVRATIQNSTARIQEVTLRGKVAELSTKFEYFSKLLARILTLKNENAMLSANQVIRIGTMLRYQLEDLSDSASLAGLTNLQTSATEITGQLVSASAAANNFTAKHDMAVADSALARITFVQKTFRSLSGGDEALQAKMKGISEMLDSYRDSFAKLVDNSKTT
jgi:methyl-accepting chemotaxis protein